MKQITKLLGVGTVSALAIIAAAGEAQADKKSGTLNLAAQQQFEGVRPIFGSPGSPQLYNRVVFDKLLNFDPVAGKFVPELATSWKQINPTTWEFKLRKGVKFHNGSDFDADDVVYTINWAADPKTRFRAKGRFLWIKRAEKIDSHTVRVVTKRPHARALGILSVQPALFPSDLHGSFLDCGGGGFAGAKGGKGKGKRRGKRGKRGKGGKGKTAAKTSPEIIQARRAGKCKSDYGRRSPIGTGAYRVASIAGSQGLTLEAVDSYPQANSVRPLPAIKRVKIEIIPDNQTRVAKMLTGGVDVTRIFTKDIGRQLARDPRFAVTTVNGLRYRFFFMDAADRSGIGVFKDIRVRRAITHAIDRAALKKNVIVGGEKAFDVKALCVPIQINCSTTVALPEYDPAKAKKLLAEAGHPDGFSLKISTIPPTRDLAVAVSGYLKKIGIKATVQSVPFGAYRRMAAQNKHQAGVQTYGSSGVADAGTTIWFHYINRVRDFARDPRLKKAARTIDTILDPQKRAKAIEAAFDHVNRQSYIIPLGAAPQVFVHSKDLIIPTTTLNGYGAVLNQLRWK